MFTTPLGLLALLAVPLVALLHLLRRRTVPRVVSALFLWQDGPASPAGGRRLLPPERTASFWLELLAALALALALGGPRFGAPRRTVHQVCVLDDCVSLQARDANGTRAADRARELVAARLDALPADSRVTLVRTGAPPELLAGPAAYLAEARRALAEWEPRARTHSPRAALALGRQLAGEEAAVLFVTDRFEPDDHPPEIELAAVGRPLENAALTRARRGALRGPAGERGEGLFLDVLHRGAEPARRRLRLEVEGREPSELELVLVPGGRRSLALPLPPGAGVVRARLVAPAGMPDSNPDGLDADDLAVLVPEPVRTVTLAVDLPPETADALGLGPRGALRTPAARWAALAGDAQGRETPSSGVADLLLCTDALDTEWGHGGPRTWTLELIAESETAGNFRVHTGPFLGEWQHPLLDGTDFGGVRWVEAGDRAPEGVPLLAAGDATLLTELAEPRRRRFQLDLAVAASNLQRTPDWPILLQNLVALRRTELDGPRATNLAVGDDFVWRGAAPGDWELRGPAATTPARVVRSVRVADGAGELRFAAPEVPGAYTLVRAGGPGLTLGGEDPSRGPLAPVTIGVTLADPAAGDLTARSSGARPASAAASDVAAEDSGPAAVLAALGLLLLLADAWVLARASHPRSTAGSSRGASPARP